MVLKVLCPSIVKKGVKMVPIFSKVIRTCKDSEASANSELNS